MSLTRRLVLGLCSRRRVVAGERNRRHLSDDRSSPSRDGGASNTAMFQPTSSFTVQVDSNRPDNPQEKTAVDKEREMFLLKRKMSDAYSRGHYQSALDCAVELEEKSLELMGKRNAVYASCLNNTALMHKMLGQREASMSKYVEALHVYEDVVGGKNHTSYASTLANLGVLYKDLARGSTGLERQQLLERASEALGDALSIRTTLLGADHKDTLYSSLHMASLHRLRADLDLALQTLSEAMAIATKRFGSDDLICAAISNDLGMVHKSSNRFEAARECYQKARDIRSKVLGDSHPDTIVSIHNLAELHSAAGDQEMAKSLQRQLVDIFEASGHAVDDAVGATPVVVDKTAGDARRDVVHVETDSLRSSVDTPTVTTTSSATSREDAIRRPFPTRDALSGSLLKPSSRRKRS